MSYNGAENPQPSESNKRFESDTEKLVNKHLSDPNHVITDEELQSLRVGMVPPLDTSANETPYGEADNTADLDS
ncbi:MAG: hypothetical protein EON98_03785 [Chitinophagaceae bacterium]|nr:MAG: hypothetical protein EON98_03785 [Chitinophagaceae bacterium]